jgi:outer membrane immunogenic protein
MRRSAFSQLRSPTRRVFCTPFEHWGTDMKQIRITALASAALCGLALMAPSQAADLFAPPPPEVYAPVMNWTGFYIGAGGGGNFLFADSYTALDVGFFNGNNGPVAASKHDFFTVAEASADLGAVGGFGTVQGGFDWQFGDRFVVGVFGNYDFGGRTRASHSARFSDFGFPFPPYPPNGPLVLAEHGGGNAIRARVTLGDSWAVGGRFGFLSSESTLWYGLAGYTQARITGEAGHDFAGFFLPQSEYGGGYQYRWSGWRDGVVLGAGVETLLTDAISLKMEYRYTNYKSFRGYGGSDLPIIIIDPPFGEVEQRARFDPEVHSIRGVVSWRFGNLF